MTRGPVPTRTDARAERMRLARAESRASAHRPPQRQRTLGERNLITAPRKHFSAMFGVSKNYVDMARRVLDYSAELAEQVAAGKSLDEAYSQATVVP